MCTYTGDSQISILSPELPPAYLTFPLTCLEGFSNAKGLCQNYQHSSPVCSSGSHYFQSLQPKLSSWLPINLVQASIWSSLDSCSLFPHWASYFHPCPSTVHSPLRIKCKILTTALDCPASFLPLYPLLPVLQLHRPLCFSYSPSNSLPWGLCTSCSCLPLKLSLPSPSRFPVIL